MSRDGQDDVMRRERKREEQEDGSSRGEAKRTNGG